MITDKKIDIVAQLQIIDDKKKKHKCYTINQIVV